MTPRQSDSRFPVFKLPPGSIRRHVRQTAKLRTVEPIENPNTRAQALEEIRQTIPRFDVDAGRAEIAHIHAVARQREQETRPAPRCK